MEKVRLIAPSRRIRKKDLLKAFSRLKEYGYESVVREDIIDAGVYFAGTLKRRINEINQAFLSREKIIFCATGGFASVEILRNLNWKKILKTKKTLIGHSDITSLLLGFYSKKYKGLLVHGQMPCSKYWGKSKMYKDCIQGKKYGYKIRDAKFVNKNSFSGEIVGGNLRIITHLIGTEFDLNTKGKILFLEDVNEKPSSIYAMFLHLEMVGKLKNIKALLLGKMIKSGKYLPLLEEYLLRLKIPVIYELPLGHCNDMIPIRIGSNVKFDSLKNTLSFN